MKHYWLSVCWMLLFAPAMAQTIGSTLGNESLLYAETKQVNQFFRRFNGEEDLKGLRYYPSNDHYRNRSIRKRYFELLFDLESVHVTAEQKTQFTREMLDKEHPDFLDFHGGDWFAEVKTRFIRDGQEDYLWLFLRLEQDGLGYKWSITNVYYPPYSDAFANSKNKEKFLHPMSHELDFMNLIKVFSDKQRVEEYTAREYNPDYLTLLLYDIKTNRMKFKSVMNVKFHFFQAPGWYFELANFNRKGGNTGWLISNLIEINQEEKARLIKFIYHE